MQAKLFGYWRSSATWRVRWACALKKIPYEYIPVNILAKEHTAAAHLARNPLGALPVMEVSPGEFLSQSMAILMWLEENTSPSVSLFGRDRTHRYKIIELCELINADTAPLQVPRVQNAHSADADAKLKWATLFTRQGLGAFAQLAQSSAGDYCVGKEVSAADLFVVPQIYNARRFKIDVAAEFPLLERIYQKCFSTAECLSSSPEKQVDAVPA